MEHPLGLESGTVRVVPYDPAWPRLYAVEVARLLPFLDREGVSLVFEHTGSTAIPGMAAKPILDILAGRGTDAEREPAIRALQAAGYRYRGEQEIPGRDFFRRGEPRQYHMHVAHMKSEFWRDHRAFRDYLRSHADAAAEYAALKRELAVKHPFDREAYIEGKGAFVQAILRLATGTGTLPGT
jgi:GrpB-like predicted nucleotidyltransferase (UPF0157 family)